MSDLLHDHVEIGLHSDCPACIQLERDFARMSASHSDSKVLVRS